MTKRPNIKYCRDLRKEQTNAEKLLWLYLRNRQLNSVKFRRQYSFEAYILDFYAPALKLAIELDGGHHYEDKGLKNDAKRTEFLNLQGIRVLRFSNSEVLGNLEGVYTVIEDEIEKISPQPGLLPRGEKE